MIRALIIAGVEVPLHAALSVRQTYETVGGASLLRLHSGGMRKQVHWQKLRTTIRGEGNIPPGLEAVDWSGSFTLSCIQPRTIVGVGAANVLTLPAGRRTDAGYVPRGFAFIDGLWRPAVVNIAGDTATVTTASSASRYRVSYYPEFTAWSAQGVLEDGDARLSRVSWTLDAEEG